MQPNQLVRKVILASGFLFLYIPIIVLICYSFNESRMVNVWSGFSFKWYLALVNDYKLLEATRISLYVAFASSTTSVVLGAMISSILLRFKHLKGKTVLANFVTAPLVMPDIIIGISLLLLFVSSMQAWGWPAQRGFLTLWLSHSTFCTSYAVVIISARLKQIDKTLENAAMDLGANPLKTFISVTLPILMPALVSAWLLTFTLSLDDVVIASFVTGPGSTTLPMIVLSSIKLGVSPKINALATIIILVVSMVTLSGWFIAQRVGKTRNLSGNT